MQASSRRTFSCIVLGVLGELRLGLRVCVRAVWVCCPIVIIVSVFRSYHHQHVCAWFVVRCSLFVVRCSLFVVRCSLLVADYKYFAALFLRLPPFCVDVIHTHTWNHTLVATVG